MVLVIGVLMFLAFVMAIIRSGALDPAPWSLEKAPLTQISLGVGVLIAALAVTFPRFLLASARGALKEGRFPGPSGPPPTDPAQRETVGLLGGIQTAFICRMALLEGAALLATVALMLEGKAPSLVFALIAMGLMIAQFPTAASVERQLETERALLRE
jgi:hypothetical protein